MTISLDYQPLRVGKWRLLVQTGEWSRELWEETIRQMADGAPAGAHPVTRRFRCPEGKEGGDFYLKIYHRPRFAGTVKDLFRQSKAFRSLRQGLAMARHGFHVPLVVAAGEERDCRLLKRAFLLTVRVEGSSLPVYLEECFGRRSLGPALLDKRGCLHRLALEISRLHRLGFIHGDLVPSNILVQAEKGGAVFFYIDNDRTRRYPVWFPQRLWRRNLVQLNRFVLPGISLEDRMRFLKSYLGGRDWARKEHRLARWLEKKTRKRRRDCDRIDAQVSFRELMRWNGPFTRHIQ